MALLRKTQYTDLIKRLEDQHAKEQHLLSEQMTKSQDILKDLHGKQRGMLLSFHKQLPEAQYDTESKKQKDELIARHEMEIGKILDKFSIWQKELVVKHQERKKKFEAKKPEGMADEKEDKKGKSASSRRRKDDKDKKEREKKDREEKSQSARPEKKGSTSVRELTIRAAVDINDAEYKSLLNSLKDIDVSES